MDAARAMARLKRGARIAPDPARADAYDALYRDWLELHDHFGRGGTDVMARLRRGAGDERRPHLPSPAGERAFGCRRQPSPGGRGQA